jgi:hypothetical protein
VAFVIDATDSIHRALASGQEVLSAYQPVGRERLAPYKSPLIVRGACGRVANSDLLTDRRFAMLAKLGHLAISSPDPDKAAAFCMKAFGIEKVGEAHNPTTDGAFLSDSTINLALLRYRRDDMLEGACKDSPLPAQEEEGAR